MAPDTSRVPSWLNLCLCLYHHMSVDARHSGGRADGYRRELFVGLRTLHQSVLKPILLGFLHLLHSAQLLGPGSGAAFDVIVQSCERCILQMPQSKTCMYELRSIYVSLTC